MKVGINSGGLYETAFSLNPTYDSVQVRQMPGYENTGVRANRANNTTPAEVPAVTANPHYHNDDAANDSTSALVSTADPYASLLSAASAYGTRNGAVIFFNNEDTDDEESDFDI